MALSNSTVWEVRTTGSDNNGGGFVTGASGADFSQQDSAQYTFTDLASTNGTNASPQVTSASHSFVSTDVGNIMQITAGTNWTTGFYQIVSVAGGAATLDKACGSAASLSAGTYAVGGALASPGMAGAAHVARNIIWIKNGTYTLTNSTANTAGGPVKPLAGGNAGNTAFRGYNTVRWSVASGPTASDIANRPTILNGAFGSISLFDGTNGSFEAICLILDANSQTSVSCLDMNTAFNSQIQWVTAKNFTVYGIRLGQQSVMSDCEATGGTSAATAGIYIAQANSMLETCWAHANACPGFNGASNSRLVRCISSGNTGSAGKGFAIQSEASYINCVAYGNAQAGFEIPNGAGFGGPLWDGCIAYGNTGVGFNAGGATPNLIMRNCAAGSNTGGNVSSNITRQWGLVTLSGDPFVNAAGGNFSLNSTAGAGAACRAGALPGLFIGGLSTGYLDIGAVQHQDPAGGGGLLTHPGMTGGMRG